MKYIIDVPDEVLEFMNGKFNFFIEPEVKVGECKHYKVRLDDTEVTPYTESDRKAIEDDVWEFVRMFSCLGNYAISEIGDDKNTTDPLALIEKYSYQQLKSKYEAWKKKEEEIRVGDEVVPLYAQYDTMVVTKLWVSECHDEWVDTIASDGKFFSFLTTSIKKTGRHFDDVEELLKKMRI